jgi:hypothetical protein
MIFIQEPNPFSNESLVIEEDANSIYAYRLNSEQTVLQDIFICSTGKIVETANEIKEAIDLGFAPPLLRSFANEYSIQKYLTEDDISINWISVEEVVVCIKRKPFARLNGRTKECFSIALNKDGPYGKAWKSKG